MGMQFRDPGVIIFTRSHCDIELVVIGDVVPVHALRAGLEIGRCVGMTDPELIKIRYNFARLPEGEVPVELQAVGRDWNFGMLGFHNVPRHPERQRKTSAACSEKRGTIFRSPNITSFAIARFFHFSVMSSAVETSLTICVSRSAAPDSEEIPRLRSESQCATSFLAPRSRAISARVVVPVRSNRTTPVAMNALLPPLSEPDTPRKKHESCSPARINNSPECSSGNRSALAARLPRTDTGVLPNPVPSAPPRSRRSVAVSRQIVRRLAVASSDLLCGKSSESSRKRSASKAQCFHAAPTFCPRKKRNRSSDIVRDRRT